MYIIRIDLPLTHPASFLRAPHPPCNPSSTASIDRELTCHNRRPEDGKGLINNLSLDRVLSRQLLVVLLLPGLLSIE